MIRIESVCDCARFGGDHVKIVGHDGHFGFSVTLKLARLPDYVKRGDKFEAPLARWLLVNRAFRSPNSGLTGRHL